MTEIARAAGVSASAARRFVDSRRIPVFEGFVSASQAVRCVRLLSGRLSAPRERELFSPPPPGERSAGAGVVASGAVHAGMLGLIVLLTLGFSSARDTLPERLDPARLVFLVRPGPGGGGGGGGLKQPEPAVKAEMKGPGRVKSPVPPPKRLTTQTPAPRITRPEPPPLRPLPTPAVEPPPPAPRPAVTPQVVAPVVTASSDARDRAGVLSESPTEPASQGSGTGAGVGTGQGTGIGEGSGAGIGPGSGGGTGGGPYRPGSGITPPELLREVRPDYTDDARRRGIEGDVVLEIVVRHDGTVGDVKVLQSLAGGLDRRATDAVRQWRFAPARRHGTPVDVIVEVAVEFKLR